MRLAASTSTPWRDAQYAKSVECLRPVKTLRRTATFFGVGNRISGTNDFEPATKNALESLVGRLGQEVDLKQGIPGVDDRRLPRH